MALKRYLLFIGYFIIHVVLFQTVKQLPVSLKTTFFTKPSIMVQ